MKNIYIIDNSLITCTLIYRLIEENIAQTNINYVLDPTDILLKDLSRCDLIIIDEALTHHRGTEVIGHLWDYIKEQNAFNFPNVLFCTNICESYIIKRLKQEKLYNEFEFNHLMKPFYPGTLERKVESILDFEKSPTGLFGKSIIPTSFISFTTGIKSLVNAV